MPDLAEMTKSLKAITEEAETLHKLGKAGRSAEQTNRLKALTLGSKGDGSDSILSIETARFESAKAEEGFESESLKAIQRSRDFFTAPVPPAYPGLAHDQAKGADTTQLYNEYIRHQKAILGINDPVKSIGELVTESQEFLKALKAGTLDKGVNRFVFSDEASQVALKAPMTTTAGLKPNPFYSDRIVQTLYRPLVVADLIPVSTGAARTIIWKQQTTRTNNAAPRLEGAVTAFGDRVFTDQQTICQSIAQTQQITKDDLLEAPRVRKIIDTQLMEELGLVEEVQILAGNGTAPQWQGIQTLSGVQTLTRLNTETRAEVIRKACTLVWVNGLRRPSAILIHPNDLQSIELEKDDNKQFLMGHPLMNNPRNWKVPVYESLGVSEGQVIVGDFATSAERWINKDFAIEVGWINDDFNRNQLSIRAELIGAVTWYRPACFCKVSLTPA